MAGFARDTQFEGLDFEVLHKLRHAFGNGAEIVVVHLLIFGTVVSHQGAAGEEQVGACGIESFVDEEVFLFPTEVGLYLPHIVVEVLAHLKSGFIDGSERFFERGFVVERFTGVGDENGGNHQCVADEEDGTCRIPSRVAARLESGADAAVGEGGGIGLLLHEEFARKFFDHTAFAIVLHESVVLLGSAFGERLKPVCTMSGTHLDGPLLHTLGDEVGSWEIKRSATIEGCAIALIGFEREILAHLLVVEHVLGIVAGGAFVGRCGWDGALFESLFHDFKSQSAHKKKGIESGF